LAVAVTSVIQGLGKGSDCLARSAILRQREIVSSARGIVTLVLGVAMFAIGLYVAVRPLWTHNATVTGARWLDMAFAVVFMLRGIINVRTAMRRRNER
jgi:uncharacterized membrane protein HdeD (DUF308 family)